MFTPKTGTLKFGQSDDQEKNFKKNACFSTVPKGIVIFDSFNNPFYPIKTISLDNSLYNTRILKEEFHKNYGSTRDYLNLPWHFTIELIGRDYNVNDTRPLLYRSAVPEWEDYICVCIIGDTASDIYNKLLYKKIANVLNSFRLLPGWRMNLKDNLHYVEIKDSFKKTQLHKDLI